MNLRDLKKELLKKPSLKKAFKNYDLAFEISQMLTEARIIKGITQKQLAKMIKSQQSSIARAENSSTLPSLSFLEKIAKSLNTNLIVRFAFMEPSIKIIIEGSKETYEAEQLNFNCLGSDARVIPSTQFSINSQYYH